MSSTWTDPKTGLMWARISIGQRWESGEAVGDAHTMSWDDANEAVRHYRLAGFEDWRLPNIEELESIALKDQAGTIAPQGVLPFPTVSDDWWLTYWSASPNGYCLGYGAMDVYCFGIGNTLEGRRDAAHFVRVVRNA